MFVTSTISQTQSVPAKPAEPTAVMDAISPASPTATVDATVAPHPTVPPSTSPPLPLTTQKQPVSISKSNPPPMPSLIDAKAVHTAGVNTVNTTPACSSSSSLSSTLPSPAHGTPMHTMKPCWGGKKPLKIKLKLKPKPKPNLSKASSKPVKSQTNTKVEHKEKENQQADKGVSTPSFLDILTAKHQSSPQYTHIATPPSNHAADTPPSDNLPSGALVGQLEASQISNNPSNTLSNSNTPENTTVAIQKVVQNILNIPNFPTVFALLSLKLPPKNDFNKILIHFVKLSLQKGYHTKFTNFSKIQKSGNYLYSLSHIYIYIYIYIRLC